MTWTELLTNEVIPHVAVIVLGVLGALAAVAIRYLERRLSIDIPAQVEDQVQIAVGMAVAATEQWAKVETKARSGERPVGNELLEHALREASAEIRRRRLPERARDELVRRIHAELGARLLDQGPPLALIESTAEIEGGMGGVH